MRAPFFAGPARMVRVERCMSDSGHPACRMSSDRTAVTVRIPVAVITAQCARVARTVATAPATAKCGSARWCLMIPFTFSGAAPVASQGGLSLP